ncbi:acyl-coenzyme A thioesterase 9 [Entomortierella parvispora]|uniref:Acyl-coenzyme A thioesterase 9 n=1 Tax=Entomortierella parvispora TaxID=205924 RepID=A0A9P3HJ45_9FUNG|nr:acyl-coenzyme A thioesterase 9 [Entomortierella parvispora]
MQHLSSCGRSATFLSRSVPGRSFLSHKSPLQLLPSLPCPASGSAGTTRRFLNTKKPLYFSGANRHLRDQITEDKLAMSKALQADKKGSELLDKLGQSAGAKSTVITTEEAPIINPGSTAAVLTASSPRTKVFTVRPITSWIDKLASQHGSPTSTHSDENGATIKKKTYQKRELVLKKMQDSYTDVILPFAKDKALLEEYINFGGTVRHGKIMEDLDALAGAISYKHADDGRANSSPLTIVTASVDRIDFLKPFGVSDLRLSGHVTYVGYSSMEVFMKMEEMSAEGPSKHGDTILVARFTMVARDALTGKAAQVNPLLLQNDTEKKLFQMGEEHKARKRLAADSALTKRPPTQEERLLIHDLYLEYSKYDDPHLKVKTPDDVEWMEDTKMAAIQIMQPQDRNIHDKIFGGYLMRLAYELAFCNASVFIKSRPLFLSLDDISFRKPVPIGTFLALDSQIVFAEGGDSHSFEVMVKADVLDIQAGTRETTNTFWFTFMDPKEGYGATPKIMPRTYAESMLYLEGKRRRMEGIKMAQLSRKNLGL